MDELRENIKRLFSDEKLDLVIGWGRGSLPLTSTPLFIHNPDEVDRLIFDETCQNNLAVYLTKDRRRLGKDGKRIGVVVKGCDGRSVVLYAVENQINRENVFIIGVPCDGVFDRKKVLKKTGGREVLEYRIQDDHILVRGREFDLKFLKQDILSDSCLTCTYPDAPIHDIFIGNPRSGILIKNEFKIVDDFEKLSLDEKWNTVKDEYSRCVRCYACRNVCPSCYCNECFVDQNDPQWIGKSVEFTDTLIFHLIRNLHVAGRCVGCGACARACPMDIDLLMLNKKITKEIRQRFNYTAGIDINEKPVLASYCENEEQDFIMG